jgi:hypothetical protein
MDITFAMSLSNLFDAEHDLDYTKDEYELRISEIARLKKEIVELEKEEYLFKNAAFNARMNLLTAITDAQGLRHQCNDVHDMNIYEELSLRCREKLVGK